MSIYDLARNPCHAFSPAIAGVPGPFPAYPIVPIDMFLLPEPPTPTNSPVPLALTISDNEAERLAPPSLGDEFFREMMKPVLKHY